MGGRKETAIGQKKKKADPQSRRESWRLRRETERVLSPLVGGATEGEGNEDKAPMSKSQNIDRRDWRKHLTRVKNRVKKLTRLQGRE